MASSYRLELERWLSSLDVKAERVLDIGGSQNPIKGRTKSWDVSKYLIADLPDPHVNSPKPDIELDLNVPIAISEEMVNSEIGTTTYKKIGDKIYDTEFDLVFCLEVYEYIFDPMTAINNIAKLLTPNGTAWITFPSFYPLHQPVEDDALRYMPAGIVKLAESAGLSVEQMIKRRPETNALQQFFSAERLRAAKNEDHAFTGFICCFTKVW